MSSVRKSSNSRFIDYQKRIAFCTKCNTRKSFDDFHVSTMHVVQYKCKECFKSYWKDTLEKAKKNTGEWRKNKLEKSNEYHRTWRKNNLEKAKKSAWEWRRNNLEKIAAYNKNYREKNKRRIQNVKN